MSATHSHDIGLDAIRDTDPSGYRPQLPFDG